MKLKHPQHKLITLPVPYPVTIREDFLFLNFLTKSEHWSTQFNFQNVDLAFLQTSPSVVLGKKKKQAKSVHTNATSEYSKRVLSDLLCLEFTITETCFLKLFRNIVA